MQARFCQRLLLLLLACATWLPTTHGAARAADATSFYEIEQYANAVTALETEFLSLIESAPSDERFYLYWTYNHLTGSWSQVENLQTQLEVSVEEESYADEELMRTTLRDQAQFVRWELGYAISDLEGAVPRVRSLNHLWINESLRALLADMRTTIDRLWADQCVVVSCIAEP
jgi:hypothetical protein